LLLATPAVPVWAQPNAARRPSQKPPFPAIERPEKGRGQYAIDLLGDRSPEVAASCCKSPAEFTSILRRDRDA